MLGASLVSRLPGARALDVEILAVSGRDHEAEKLFRELEQRAGSDALVLDLAKRLNYKTK